MKLLFLGTRGEIEMRTPLHSMHSSLGVIYRRRFIMVDAGLDWLGHLDELRPHAIVLTHAHPDHAFGLRNGAPCTVYATAECWEGLGGYPVEEKRTIRPRARVRIQGVHFEAFPVEHSIRAPAVGYRISAGRVSIFYAPDLIYIPERSAALAGARIYIGDGATLTRSFVRRRGDRLIGHAPVRTQLGWCQKEGVPRAIITHCGSEIVAGDEGSVTERVRALAAERGVRTELAYDGMEVVLRG